MSVLLRLELVMCLLSIMVTHFKSIQRTKLVEVIVSKASEHPNADVISYACHTALVVKSVMSSAYGALVLAENS